MVAATNNVGVDGAIMVSSFSTYEYNSSCPLEVYNTYPDKFRIVTPVNGTDPVIDDVVAKWAECCENSINGDATATIQPRHTIAE